MPNIVYDVSATYFGPVTVNGVEYRCVGFNEVVNGYITEQQRLAIRAWDPREGALVLPRIPAPVKVELSLQNWTPNNLPGTLLQGQLAGTPTEFIIGTGQRGSMNFVFENLAVSRDRQYVYWGNRPPVPIPANFGQRDYFGIRTFLRDLSGLEDGRLFLVAIGPNDVNLLPQLELAFSQAGIDTVPLMGATGTAEAVVRSVGIPPQGTNVPTNIAANESVALSESAVLGSEVRLTTAQMQRLDIEALNKMAKQNWGRRLSAVRTNCLNALYFATREDTVLYSVFARLEPATRAFLGFPDINGRPDGLRLINAYNSRQAVATFELALTESVGTKQLLAANIAQALEGDFETVEITHGIRRARVRVRVFAVQTNPSTYVSIGVRADGRLIIIGESSTRPPVRVPVYDWQGVTCTSRNAMFPGGGRPPFVSRTLTAMPNPRLIEPLVMPEGLAATLPQEYIGFQRTVARVPATSPLGRQLRYWGVSWKWQARYWSRVLANPFIPVLNIITALELAYELTTAAYEIITDATPGDRAAANHQGVTRPLWLKIQSSAYFRKLARTVTSSYLLSAILPSATDHMVIDGVMYYELPISTFLVKVVNILTTQDPEGLAELDRLYLSRSEWQELKRWFNQPRERPGADQRLTDYHYLRGLTVPVKNIVNTFLDRYIARGNLSDQARDADIANYKDQLISLIINIPLDPHVELLKIINNENNVLENGLIGLKFDFRACLHLYGLFGAFGGGELQYIFALTVNNAQLFDMLKIEFWAPIRNGDPNFTYYAGNDTRQGNFIENNPNFPSPPTVQLRNLRSLRVQDVLNILRERQVTALLYYTIWRSELPGYRYYSRTMTSQERAAYTSENLREDYNKIRQELRDFCISGIQLAGREPSKANLIRMVNTHKAALESVNSFVREFLDGIINLQGSEIFKPNNGAFVDRDEINNLLGIQCPVETALEMPEEDRDCRGTRLDMDLPTVLAVMAPDEDWGPFANSGNTYEELEAGWRGPGQIPPEDVMIAWWEENGYADTLNTNISAQVTNDPVLATQVQGTCSVDDPRNQFCRVPEETT